MKRQIFLALILIAIVAIVGCGGGGGGGSKANPFTSDTNINSPHGQISLEAKATASNGLICKYDTPSGKFAIFLKDGKLLHVLQGTDSNSKAVAWSPNGLTVVIMDHNAGNQLHFFDAADGIETKTVPSTQLTSNDYFHYMVFKNDNEIILSYHGQVIDFTYHF